MKNLKKILLFIVCVVSLTSCGANNPSINNPTAETEFLIDTVVTIKIYDSSKNVINQVLGTQTRKNKAIIARAMKLCKDYENMLSKTIESSDVFRINNAKGSKVEVSPQTVEVLKRAIEFNKISGGVFDVTIGAVSALWNFEPESPKRPSDEEIKKALPSVGSSGIILEGNTVRLQNPETQIDLGGIAKGYIADKLAEFLKTEGVKAALVSLGGNIITVGQRGGNLPWTIGIQRPFEKTNEMIAAVKTGETSVVSSGIYERYFNMDGKFYHHILDTKTGYPVETDIVSVSIITKASMDADALSTTVFGLGVEKGIALIESMEDAECIFIQKNGELVTSSGIGRDIPIEYMNKK